MMIIKCNGSPRIRSSLEHVVFLRLFLHYFEHPANGWSAMSCFPNCMDLTVRDDSQDIRCQSGLEIKCCSSILYIMLVVECEDSFKQEIGVFCVVTSNDSVS